MVLGKRPGPGRPTNWMTVGQGPTALAIGAGGGYLDIFTLLYLFSPLSPSLWETARYRQRTVNPKTINQSESRLVAEWFSRLQFTTSDSDGKKCDVQEHSEHSRIKG